MSTTQVDAFTIYLKYYKSKAARPAKGWCCYVQLPTRIEPVTSARGLLKRWKRFEDMLDWISINYQGYQLLVDWKDWKGVFR